MSVRVTVAPSVLSWALDVTKANVDDMGARFTIDAWLSGDAEPTLKQLHSFAKATGVPFGLPAPAQASPLGPPDPGLP